MGRSITIFEVTPKKEGVDGMFKNVGEAVEYVAKAPGFVRVEPFKSIADEGKFLFLCVFENEESAAAWRNLPEHRVWQKDGHDNLFESYSLSVCNEIRYYTKESREEAPADSNIEIKSV